MSTAVGSARRRGFTLIELLVVIAIIGILASMVFPVFARARESARKAVCLSNIKNINLAMQMYLGDYGAFPPRENRQEIVDSYADTADRPYSTWANPYLRWPVVLDEYTRNRQVWACPSARLQNAYSIMNHQAYGYSDWWEFRQFLDGEGCGIVDWNRRPFPPGWGGVITDSYAQGCVNWYSNMDQQGAGFVQNINGVGANYGLKDVEIPDPVRWLAVVEIGLTDTIWDMNQVAYPEICQWHCTSCSWYMLDDPSWKNDSCCLAYCPWIEDCRAGLLDFATDPSFRKPYARHLGGVNLGFADGHAKWMSSEAILNGSRNHPSRAGGTGENFPVQSEHEVDILGPLSLCMWPSDQH